MKHKKEEYAVGVLVGRFQVHELHTAHYDLIKSVCNEHDKVIIFLGLSPLMVTRNNPLDFESRKQMILQEFPEVNVLYIKDTKEDEPWSTKLDEQISDLVGSQQSVVLYGSRDSFISHYTGKYNTQELLQESFISGTEIRRSISRKVKNTPEFRAGVIWGAYNQYPKTYATVDVAVLNEEETKILLARKPFETQFRFIGGFSDPESESYEEDARREVYEEACIDVTDPIYLGSFKVDDWRYRSEIDKIKTMFFVCRYFAGKPEARDDVVEVRWFDLNDFYDHKLYEFDQTVLINKGNLVDNHVMLMRRLIERKVAVKKLVK